MHCLQVAYMEGLKAKGLELFAAYGNTGTDARASCELPIRLPECNHWQSSSLFSFADFSVVAGFCQHVLCLVDFSTAWKLGLEKA